MVIAAVCLYFQHFSLTFYCFSNDVFRGAYKNICLLFGCTNLLFGRWQIKVKQIKVFVRRQKVNYCGKLMNEPQQVHLRALAVLPAPPYSDHLLSQKNGG